MVRGGVSLQTRERAQRTGVTPRDTALCPTCSFILCCVLALLPSSPSLSFSVPSSTCACTCRLALPFLHPHEAMPDVIVPMSGVQAEKFLAEQRYDTDSIKQNMFSAATKKGMKPMIPPTLLKGVTIQKLWDAVHSNRTHFLRHYHDRRKETDLKVGEWCYAPDKGSGYRAVSLTTLVDVPKVGTPTPLNEAHRFVYVTTDDGKLMVVYQISSQTPNVPAGGTFRTEAYCEITADNAEADCSIGFWGNCRKMSMAFSVISGIAGPRAIREMTAAYKLMVDMILEDLCGGPPVAVPDSNAEADSGAASDGGGMMLSGRANGDGADAGAVPSSTFQGVLLLLALLVALSLIRSLTLVNRTAGQAAVASQLAQRMEGGGKAGIGGETVPQRYPVTEEQALMNAAREAQLQTLRYRWLEQRSTLGDIQSSLSTIRWMVYVQWFVVLGIGVKVFFF